MKFDNLDLFKPSIYRYMMFSADALNSRDMKFYFTIVTNSTHYTSSQSKITATEMNELIPEVELRELSRNLGTLIPKQETYLESDDLQYFLLV